VARNKNTTSFTELGDDEIVRRLAEAKDEVLNLRFQLATGQQENTSRIGAVKKDIARLNTVLRQREIAAAEALENANG
jgi:large subunit ribosomal protein L29